eukprot:TRINITY_DN2323_c0_g2_i2.p1 TRINITY_DN2323_c0_g2~~TRINITY_DN2323_c0_g2_i2.p1  ORF type:complete len:682 (-),score=244.38 TRINITY_DN2323_c0_g2_i2:49-2094(-)
MPTSMLAFLALASAASASVVKLDEAVSGTNPVRKVVNLMEKMQAKIEAEAKKEDGLFDKFQCYCKKTQKQLEDDIAKAAGLGNVKPEDIEAKEAQLKQLEQLVESLKNDKIDEEKMLSSAKAARDKEHQAYLTSEKDHVETENAAEAAIATLKANETDPDKNTHEPVQNPGAFLSRLEKASQGSSAFSDKLAAFLQGRNEATPGEVTATIKDMEEKAEEAWRKEVADDAKGNSEFEDVKSSKQKSIKTVLEETARKAKKIGDLRVEIVNMKHALAGGAEALAENRKMLAELKKDCAQRASEQEEKKALRADEEKALQDTIKMLTDDDALDLFRKTIKPSSLLQLDAAREQARMKALRIVNDLKAKVGGRPELSFVALALAGKKVDFAKVLKRIDDMVTLLSKEGQDDASKKGYCNKEFDEAKDKAKDLKSAISALSSSLEEKQTSIEKIAEEIKSINEGVQSLDMSVSEATENRKAESADYQELLQQDSAAVELLNMAKDRLNQFYNPELVRQTTTKGPYDLSLVQVSEHEQKPQANNGVLSMIATMVSDLKKEMSVAKVEETSSQKEYEALVADAKEKRASDLQDAQKKAQVKADLEQDLDEDAQEKSASIKEQEAATAVIGNLHKECDWLLQNFELRREAREEEVENLKRAKAVLSGADYSLLQMVSAHRHRRLLRGKL